MKTVIIIQARTGSTRLPGKVLMPLAGRPLLERMLERVGASSFANAIVVATTHDKSDDVIVDLCDALAYPCYRGNTNDLLDRHYQVAKEHQADVVVKIPSDCPLIDPAIIDSVLGHFYANAGQCDFASNLHPATYPDGNDVEVIPLPILEKAWEEATKGFEREHTTPFIWERPERFRITNVRWETGLNYSMTHRFTIDYPQDYEFIKRIYDELWSIDRPVFSLNEILELLRQKPEIYRLNANLAGLNWYRHYLGDLRTVSVNDTNMDVLLT